MFHEAAADFLDPEAPDESDYERVYIARLKRQIINKYDEEEDEFKEVEVTARNYSEAEEAASQLQNAGWEIVSLYEQ